jgi:hypothetical protein
VSSWFETVSASSSRILGGCMKEMDKAPLNTQKLKVSFSTESLTRRHDHLGTD